MTMERAVFSIRRFVACALISALAACAGGGAVPSANSPGVAPVAPSKAHKIKAHLRIRIPKHKHKRHGKHGRYVSPATQGIVVTVNGPNGFSFNQVAGLTIAANPQNCSSSLASTSCVLTIPGLAPCPSPANCYTLTMATYDSVTGCPDNCSISGAQALSANQNVGFNIASGAANQINVTLDAIPAGVTLVPDGNSSVQGNTTNGYAADKCGSGGATFTDGVSVLATDADGNYILGPGEPVATLTPGNTALIAVATPPPSAPNHFVLTHSQSPAAPVPLTATVTPLDGAGASPVTLNTSLLVFPHICGVVTEFSITVNANPNGVAEGPDGNIWFTECTASKIGRVTTDGVVTEFATTTASARPQGITSGPDAALWFSENDVHGVGRITTDGSMQEFSTGITGQPGFVANGGQDPAIWFTELGANKIGRISTTGTVSEYAVPTGSAGPQGITAGPDGKIWFTEYGAGSVGNITTDGATINEYPLGDGGGDSPFGIVTGADNQLWFAEATNAAIGTMAVDGALVKTTKTPTGNSIPQFVTLGPDGAVWFSENGQSKVGSVTTAFGITEMSLPLGENAAGLATGADGAIWFADNNTNKIGRIQ
jgi:virginiamycin B lyase